MITRIQLLALLFLCNLSFAQDAKLESNLFAFNLSANPVSVYNEFRLTNHTSIKAELGFGLRIDSEESVEKSWGIEPKAALEYRLYYNLNSRSKNGKRVDFNSGNYFSFLTNYIFPEIIGKNKKNYFSFSFGPTYGLRRAIGKKTVFEGAIGYLIPSEKSANNGDMQEVFIKIGFDFVL